MVLVRHHEHPKPPVKAFELFYDLVIVAAVVTFSDAISSRPTWSNIVWVTFAFTIIWLVWFATTFRFNHDRRDGFLDRVIIVVQMAAISACSIALGEGPGEQRTAVAVSFGVAVFTLAAMTWRSGQLQFECTKFFRVRTAVLVFVGLCTFSSAFLPDAWYGALWAIAGFSYLGFWVVHHIRPNWQVPAIDVHHLAERLGLLTIIVLGESFVKLAIVASGGTVSTLNLAVGVAMFIAVFGIFWSYFDDVPFAGIAEDGPRRFALLGGHLIMQLGCIGLAVGMAYLAKESSESIGWQAGEFAAGSVAVVFLGLAALAYGTCRRPLRSLTGLRLATAALLAGLVAAIPLLKGLDPSVLGYGVAAIVLVHAAISERLVQRTCVSGPVGESLSR